MTRLAVLAPMLLLGCTPHSAELTSGEFTAFISDTTSTSILKDYIDPAKDYDETYFTIDCRTFEEVDAKLSDDTIQSLRIGTADDRWHDVCGNKAWPAGNAPDHEAWLLQSPYWVVTEELDPWRGEAIITSEGDLQIGFHHRLKGGADFRFAITVDPDFAPQRCEQTANGVEPVPYDGDWIAEWSKDLTDLGEAVDANEELAATYAHYAPFLDGSLFYLNAFGYQINWYSPTCTYDGSVDNCYWYFPESFNAGISVGKFSDEEMYSRSPMWGEPAIYNSVVSDLDITPATPADLWYCDPDASTAEAWTDPESADCALGTPGGTYGAVIERAETVAAEIGAEIAVINDGNPTNNPDVAHLQPLVHDNTWRVPDGRPEDLDGWAEMHYNSIVFSKDSVLEVGGSATGAFTLLLDGTTSLSKVFVKGTFQVDRIRKDHWVTDDLRVEKAAEAGYDYEAQLCTIL